MKAAIHTQRTNGKNYSRDKETISSYVAVTKTASGEYIEPVTVRCYMGRSASASVVYCSIWVRSRTPYIETSGTGKAGGGGYHKASAAMYEAVKSAGIALDTDIDGRGEGHMVEAIRAICHDMGYDDVHVVSM